MPPESKLPIVTLFSQPACHLCHAARYVIQRVAREIPIELHEVNIDELGQESWRMLYADHIPVVHIDGREHARHHVDERTLRNILRGHD